MRYASPCTKYKFYNDEPITTYRRRGRVAFKYTELAQGITIIYISHRLDELFVSDRVTVMRDGNVITTKNIEEVIKLSYQVHGRRELGERFPERKEKYGDIALRSKISLAAELILFPSSCVRYWESAVLSARVALS